MVFLSPTANLRVRATVSPPRSGAAQGRLHYWDVARAGLMLLGIPLHAASIYSPTVSFIHAADSSATFDVLGGIIHAFRMSAFYCVAGFFAGMLLARRDSGAWLKGRIVRLGVPLLFGVALLGPFHIYIEALAASQRYGTAVPLQIERLLAEPNYWRWFHHLWFLVPLLWMCAGAALLHATLPAMAAWRAPQRLQTKIASRIVLVALGFAAAIGFYRLGTNWMFFQLRISDYPALSSIAFIPDVVQFLPSFALGMALSRADIVLRRFVQPLPALWIIGAIAALAYAALNSTRQLPELAIVLRAFAGVCVTHVVLSAARTWFDRPSALVDRIVAASFGIYVLHYPLIAVLGLALDDVSGWVAIKYVGVCVVVLAASYALSRAARFNRWSNLMINGVAPAKRRNPA